MATIKKLTAAAATLAATFSFGANAAPTIEGLGVDQISIGDANVYAESNNDSVLWLTPRTQGTLTLNQSPSTFVTKDTCEAAARNVGRKRKFVDQIVDKEDKIIELEDRILDLDPEADAREIVNLEKRIERTERSLGRLEGKLARVKTDPDLLKDGGVYSYVARTGVESLITSVQERFPDKTVQVIQTNVTSVVPSLTNDELTENSDIFSNVGFLEGKDLLSATQEIQIDVSVTKLGACFLEYPDVMGSSSSEPFKFAFVINYTHPFLFKSKVEAKFNYFDLYRKVIKTKKKRRLFSSKSYSTVVETRELREDMNLKVVSDTPLGPELRRKLERQATEFVLNMAMSEASEKIKEASDPGPTGAVIAANELSAVCGTNAYCQGTAVGLKILDGIFGGSSTQAELKRVIDIERVYKSESGETLPVNRAISYVAQ